MSDALSLRTETAPGGTVTLVAEGELDLFTVPLLRDRLFEELSHIGKAPGPEAAAGAYPVLELVLDLRDVHFIDSAGLALLIEGNRAAGERFAVLIAVNGQVSRALKATRLHEYLSVRVAP